MSTWGLSMGGGGVPGIAAHLGFLSVLEANGLMPPVMVGTSAGGLVAGGLATRHTLKNITAAWRHLSCEEPVLFAEQLPHMMANFVKRGPTPGFFDLCGIVKEVYGLIGASADTFFAEGYGVSVTDESGKTAHLIARGRNEPHFMATTAITATAAFPVVFSGVRGADGHLYSDGGQYHLVPCDYCRTLGAQRVVAVRIGGGTIVVPPTLSLEQSAEIVLSRLIRSSQSVKDEAADLKIDIATTGGLITMSRFEDDFSAGQKAAAANLDAIRELAGAGAA